MGSILPTVAFAQEVPYWAPMSRFGYCTVLVSAYFGVRNELGQTQSWATSRIFYCRSNVPDKSIESQTKIIACMTKDNKSIETIYNIRTLLINQR